MSSQITSESLQKIIVPKYLGPSDHILKCDITRLTAPGENYGSLMLAINLSISEGKTEKTKQLYAVAKAVPNNAFVQKVFKSPISFRKELELYRTVVPSLKQFQESQNLYNGLQFFPDYYGGQMGSGNSESFDPNAIILLENLKKAGYTTIDRTKGFDLATSKLLLRDLAELHATTIAMRLKDFEGFTKKILPHLNPVNAIKDVTKEIHSAMLEEFCRIASGNPTTNLLTTRLKKALLHTVKMQQVPQKITPFTTLAHCDFWVNNTLIKFQNEKPLSSKMVDFQVYEYLSSAKDVTFFLFVSVQNEVIIAQYDELIQCYWNHFLEVLKKLNVQDLSDYTFPAFEAEMKRIVQEDTLFQCMFMLKPIFAASDKVKDVEELTAEDFQGNREPTQPQKDKLWMIVQEFAKRNWI